MPPEMHTTLSGRAAAIARRQALSAGKSALPPPRERVRDGERTASLPGAGPARAVTATPAASPTPPAAPAGSPAPLPAALDSNGSSCRQLARARRAALSLRGRGDAPPALPSRGSRDLKAAEVTPAVAAAMPQRRQLVTGLHVGRGAAMTGDEAGSTLPVSGTQYISLGIATPVRNGGPKVGVARTPQGLKVSGTLVRSQVAVTGDEPGHGLRITGEADPVPADDLTPRSDAGAWSSAQFPRQAEPHGNSVFGMNPHRRVSVTRDRIAAVEATQRGQRVTGPSFGHSALVTGGENGTAQAITGDQYLTTGRDSGDGDLSRASVVTGDTPLHSDAVTGTARGAARDITGTPYFRAEPATGALADPVAAIDSRFSVRSPQRSAQLRAPAAAGDVPSASSRMTGSFAIGQDKVTGNLEFLFSPRQSRGADQKPAHQRITGEGRSDGKPVTGAPWSAHGLVTGTEGTTASERNPSERAGKPQSFAGAQRFKALAHKEERKQLVTGMFGGTSKSAAKVTLSGGSQG
jgi:hypothetical protein